jgi:hypothetical protein
MGKNTDAEFFEVADALRHIYEATDPVVVIIRGHILVDTLLAILLDRYLRGGLAPFKNPTFDVKVNLAYAAGLLSDPELALFNCLNKLRNGIAHKLALKVDSEQEGRVREACMAAGFSKSLGEGTHVFQMFMTLLYSILVARLVETNEQKAPLVAPAMTDEYRQQVERIAFAPVLIAYSADILQAAAKRFTEWLESWRGPATLPKNLFSETPPAELTPESEL